MSNGTGLSRANVRGFLERSASVAALAPGMTIERLSKGALIAVQNNPALLECRQDTLMSAIIEAGQLGLEPGGVMSEAYLVPYKGKAQFQIGFRGFQKLAYRSGWLIEAEVVREGDHFDYEKGLNPRLEHRPQLTTEGRPLTYVYAIAWPIDGKGGRPLFEPMSREQVDHIKGKSLASKNGPWVTDYDEMARKTVVKRLCKRLPLDPTAEKAVEYDNRADVEEGVTWANVDPDSNGRAPAIPASMADLNALLEQPSEADTGEAPESESVEGGTVPGAEPEIGEEEAELDEIQMTRLDARYQEVRDQMRPDWTEEEQRLFEVGTVGSPSSEWKKASEYARAINVLGTATPKKSTAKK